ncbi:MAG TPA: 50S ribosomal protein L29 [Candidatus Nanoarchaeia archaeon]|nr:50S ribosomal protein L29 [Candidatus Nanoarchaeia archaeon]
MAIVRFKDIQKGSKGELDTKVKELRKELMKLQAQKTTGTLSSPGKISSIKRAIAKIKTVSKQ